MVILILSQPRSCSSYVAQQFSSLGYDIDCNGKYKLQGSGEHNKNGYCEQVKMSLLCDQLIHMKYGIEYSFLYPPKFNNNLVYCSDYKYDIDETSLLYTKNTPWEWGIERMLPGEKWYKCYEKYSVNSYEKIMSTIVEYNNDYNDNKKSIIKDPRLVFVLDYFNFDYKIVYLKRDENKVYNSCKKHYGQNLFENHDGIVSNFFNHKIKYMPFKTFNENYEVAINNFYRQGRDITIYPEYLSESELIETIRSI